MKRFKNILYVVESLTSASKSLDDAVALAIRNDARLTIIAVHEKLPLHIPSLMFHRLERARLEEENTVLGKLCEGITGSIEIEVKILDGTPFLEIIRDVLRNRRDLIVKAAEPGGGPLGGLFGSLDRHLLRKCPCPVWLIGPGKRTRIHRILAAVDFDEYAPPGEDVSEALNREILELAISLAFMEHSEAEVVHAWRASQESLMRRSDFGFTDEEADAYVKEARLEHRRWLDRLLRKTKKWVGPKAYGSVQPKTHVIKGMAQNVIPKLARKLRVDLIVMGTVARTGISGLLIGNTAETILGRIECSVLAVKPPGFTTPVTLED